MRFLVDADLLRAVCSVIRLAGYEAIDVRDIGPGTADDRKIAERAQATSACLMSGDFGFADIRNYPPGDYSGIVILELPTDAEAASIASLVAFFLRQTEVIDRLGGRLAIVAPGQIRLRPK